LIMKNGKQTLHAEKSPHRLITLFPGLLIVALALIFLPGPVSGKGKEEGTTDLSRGDPEAIADSIIQPAMKKRQLPSLVLGIVKNGQVVVRKGYGVKTLQSRARPDENTVYYIGSLSKAVTAVGIMLLVQQGKIDLNAPASDYLKGLPESWRAITVAQFMAHQSGIPQLDWKLPMFRAMLRSEVAIPLSFRPGTKQEYNNFNFAVIGKIIEAVSGVSYLDYMKQNVFAPLGMNSTGFNIHSPNAATGYRPTPGGSAAIRHEMRGGVYAIPSGHLQSTLADLLKFYEALETGKLLKPAAYRQMITRVNPELSGTPGWFERNAGGDSIVSKNGSVPGFQSIMSFAPGKGEAVVMLWTSRKPKGNNMAKVDNGLLRQICGIGAPHEPLHGDEPQE
jgi:CubicO group peptidase (beta-lactamase class C family)